MFNKRSRTEKDASTDAQRARIITTSFSGQGIAAREGEIWTLEAGVPAPPALLMNSAPYDGEIPFTAVRFNQEAARLYASANAIRTEPKPVALLTLEGVCRLLGWTKPQFKAARAAGFPAATGRRDHFDGDGIPTGHEGLWHPEVVQEWRDRVANLVSR